MYTPCPESECRITIHMVSSVDGMIARRDNSISWFDTSDSYDKGVAGEDPEAFLTTIDCYVMGSRTYEHALELSKSYGWAYGDKPTFVLTSRPFTTDKQNITFYSGTLNKLVNEELKPRYKNVWVAGGSLLTRNLLQLQLADEIRVSILPVILGDGIPFFDHIGKEQQLHLKNSVAYKNGIIELCYEIIM